MLLLCIIGGIGAAAVSMQDEAVRLIETLPVAVKKFQQAARVEWDGSRDTIEKMQRAADELDRATTAQTPVPRGVTRVQIQKPKFSIRQYLWTTVSGGVTVIGTALLVVFLAYFLLASGDAFRRKWVALSGPTLSRRRVTVQVMDEMPTRSSVTSACRYLRVPWSD